MVNLSGCKYVSNAAVKIVVETCKQLEHLNLTRLPKLTEDGLSAVASAGLQKLKYLNLYASTSISNSGFVSLANSGYSNLEFLDLCGCKEITDQTVVQLCAAFPNLTYLNLTWCVSLNDKAIVEGVAKYLTKLKLLSVYGLVRITDAAVDALEQSPNKETLETLDINGCREVTRGDDKTVRQRFPNVKVTVFHS
jgi:F-box and leucine-rich repeat protein 1 (S-phase kinase-associated protein 2)